MARPARILGGDVERVAPEYSKMLCDAMAAYGIKRKDVEGGKGSGRSTTVVWRVLSNEEDPSFTAAERVRQRILELVPELSLPPPAVAVRSAEHYEWMKLGSDLMDDDIEAFRRVVDQVREVARAMKRGREGLAALADLAGRAK